MEIGSVGGFTKKARAIYDENLGAYVKLLFRRPFGKIIVSLQPFSLTWQSETLTAVGATGLF